MNEFPLQHLLASRRPGDEILDADVMAALRSLENDPTALSNAEREMAFDEHLRAALQQSIVVPEDLHKKLIAIPLIAAPADIELKNVVSISKRRFLGLSGALGAAAAAIAGGYYFLTKPQQDSSPRMAFESWKDAAAHWANAPKLDKEGNDLAALKAHLAAKDAVVPADIPSTLAKFQPVGCQMLQVDGTKVSVVCFLKDGNLFHLFTSNFAQIAHADGFFESNGPKLWSELGWNFASWKTQPHGYMILTKAPEEQLRSLFA
jgi:hypothetical protein